MSYRTVEDQDVKQLGFSDPTLILSHENNQMNYNWAYDWWKYHNTMEPISQNTNILLHHDAVLPTCLIQGPSLVGAGETNPNLDIDSTKRQSHPPTPPETPPALPNLKMVAESRLDRKYYQLSKTLCPLCDKYPLGFRSDHELQRHINRAHALRRKAWICVDGPEQSMRLGNCSACEAKKAYNTDYNAAAHLRRVHFSTDKAKNRGGKSGGNWPSMGQLKQYWIREVDVEATEYSTPRGDSEIDINESKSDLEGSDDTELTTLSITDGFNTGYCSDAGLATSFTINGSDTGSSNDFGLATYFTSNGLDAGHSSDAGLATSSMSNCFDLEDNGDVTASLTGIGLDTEHSSDAKFAATLTDTTFNASVAQQPMDRTQLEGSTYRLIIISKEVAASFLRPPLVPMERDTWLQMEAKVLDSKVLIKHIDKCIAKYFNQSNDERRTRLYIAQRILLSCSVSLKEPGLKQPLFIDLPTLEGLLKSFSQLAKFIMPSVFRELKSGYSSLLSISRAIDTLNNSPLADLLCYEKPMILSLQRLEKGFKMRKCTYPGCTKQYLSIGGRRNHIEEAHPDRVRKRKSKPRTKGNEQGSR